ncbi:MAG: FAD-dependent oxidoreductase [Deltaproteobacteria bacterium]|nr:FAD-dependent oxidoreductase [Deltaproteobacteria bacterium]
MKLVDITLPLETSENQDLWKKEAARMLGIKPDTINQLRIHKHSIDSRQKTIKVRLRLEVFMGKDFPDPVVLRPHLKELPDNAPTLLIVGCGPAGMFAALEAIALGCKPIVLERGKDVFHRRYDLPKATLHGHIEPDSNYCFGEGGAGTFSDGKLYTRADKRGPVRKVYETFVAHGAPEKILIDAHPHIGSNRLPKVVTAMRQSILHAGGQVHFSEKVVHFLIQDSKIIGLQTAQGKEFLADAVILATGHSSRDIYKMLVEKAIPVEQKPFAVGVRIEHPQPLIDQIQYHLSHGQPRHRLLPAAKYSLATKIDERGVHSFCMCPGGYIVPAATENDEVVVNGMSLSRRNSAFANSGMVVTVEPEDTQMYHATHGVLAGIAYQKHLEQTAKQAGGHGQVAPAQRMTDFLSGRLSQTLSKSSYKPGLRSSQLDQLLPSGIVDRMKTGLQKFGNTMKGYVTDEATLLGFETRTSSPVRIPRDSKTLEHPTVENLYPCGEGAGFAGGIASAAIDGMRCAQAAAAKINNK